MRAIQAGRQIDQLSGGSESGAGPTRRSNRTASRMISRRCSAAHSRRPLDGAHLPRLVLHLFRAILEVPQLGPHGSELRPDHRFAEHLRFERLRTRSKVKKTFTGN
ncbi:MAG: hypothetical protein ABJC13_07995 [Acidobacteriota bacterium]